MSFLSPFNLLWLLPLSGVIIALYLLRIKRREVTVSSTFLWAQVLQDTQANAPLQKLKRNLLLFLQLLALIALVVAFSRPAWRSTGLGGKATALVLDASASMNASDVPGGRFAEAVRQAKHLIDRKDAGDAVALVLAGDKPTVLSPLTTDRNKLRAALDKIGPTETAGDMREAILLGAALIDSRAGATVNVLTDGAFGRLEEMSLGGVQLGFTIIGQRGANAGITAFDVRDTLGSTDDGFAPRQAFVTVQNFGQEIVRVPLTIRVNNKLANAHELTLRPGEQKSEVFDNVKADAGGIVQAQLDIRDDLRADNAAFVTLAPRRALKVLLVSEGNPFFERALTVDRRTILETVTPAAYKPDDSRNRDLTIFDEATPPTGLTPGRYLFWGRKSLGSKLCPAIATQSPDADRPALLDWNRTHPLMRFVDLANVNLLRTSTIAPAPWATILAETDSGPVIVAGETGDTRAVYVGFSLLESDLPLRVAFPIFLTNCLGYLTARPGDSGGFTRPGAVFTLAARPEQGPLTITRPDGKTDTLPLTADAPPLYDKTTTTGMYKATGKNFEQYFAVSLLSPTESNTYPVKSPSVVITDADIKAAPGGATKTVAITVLQDVWPYVAAAALLFLTAEWFAYHRRLS